MLVLCGFNFSVSFMYLIKTCLTSNSYYLSLCFWIEFLSFKSLIIKLIFTRAFSKQEHNIEKHRWNSVERLDVLFIHKLTSAVACGWTQCWFEDTFLSISSFTNMWVFLNKHANLFMRVADLLQPIYLKRTKSSSSSNWASINRFHSSHCGALWSEWAKSHSGST